MDGDATTLTASLPNDLVLFYGTGYRDFLLAPGIDWRAVDFSASTPGRQNVTGIAQLPADYARYDENGKKTPLLVTQSVLVYDPTGEPTEEVHIDHAPYGADPPLLPLGCGAEKAQTILEEARNSRVLLRTDDGYLIWCTAYEDITRIDLNEQGAYMPYVFDLPPGVKIAASSNRQQTMYVVDPDEVDVTATYPDNVNMNLWSCWLFEAENPTVWYTTTNPLDDDTTTEWTLFPYATVRSAYMRIFLPDLIKGSPPGTTYWIQVRHDAGESNYLYLDVDKMQFEPVPIDGDRTGGDRGPGGMVGISPKPPDKPSTTPSNDITARPPQNEILPVEQPSNETETPDNETEPSSIPETDAANPQPTPVTAVTPTEPATPTVTLLANPPQPTPTTATAPAQPAPRAIPAEAMSFSAAELAALVEIHEEAVPFGAAAGTVLIPAPLLTELGEKASFSVLLQAPEAGQLVLRLWADETELTGPFDPPLTLALPWKDGEAACTDESGAEISCVFDSERSLLTLTATQPGLFTLTPLAPCDASLHDPVSLAAEAEKQGFSPWALAITGVLGLSGAGTVVALRRGTHKGQGRGSGS